MESLNQRSALELVRVKEGEEGKDPVNKETRTYEKERYLVE